MRFMSTHQYLCTDIEVDELVELADSTSTYIGEVVVGYASESVTDNESSQPRQVLD